MEDTTCTNPAAAASWSARDANPREEVPFPLSDEELLELAVMICLVSGVGSSSRAHEQGVDWWGGA
ncbi:MAG TPA: hypothetical protein VH704_11675 [Casimicrobiaceae bacterium]|jgi:hypothetical protein|nr:hypothetical protein [Casimicrobiaceae bacterium]